jgi:hypothetical protein
MSWETLTFLARLSESGSLSILRQRFSIYLETITIQRKFYHILLIFGRGYFGQKVCLKCFKYMIIIQSFGCVH